MRKKVLTVLVLIFTMFSVFCSDTDSKTLNMALDLQSESTDGIWESVFGFTVQELDKEGETFTAETIVAEKTDEFVLTNGTAYDDEGNLTIKGTGNVYVYWKIRSPYKITGTLKSSALKIDDSAPGIDWSTSWTPKANTTNSPNLAVADGSSISFSDYGGDAGAKVFTHDGAGVAISSYGFVKLPIETENAADKIAGKYTTNIVLTITTDKGAEGSN